MTSATIKAISDWQESLDQEPTGRIELGELIFQDGEIAVVALSSHLGAVVEPGETVLDVRTGDPFVDVSTDSSWVTIGTEVRVDLGANNMTGTVTGFSDGIAHVVLSPQTTVRDGRMSP